VIFLAWQGAGNAVSAEMKNSDSEIQQVKQAAQEATKMFFPRAENRKTVFGFNDDDSLASATLEAPVPLYSLEESDLSSYQTGQSLDALLKPTGQWLVPVAVGGSNRAMITIVGTTDGKWTGSTFGMAPLARKWQNIQAWWPAANQFTPHLIICPFAQGYFFSIPQVKPPNLTSLSAVSDTQMASSSAPQPQLVPAEQCLTGWREILKQTTKPDSENKKNDTKSP
jgi:hypothetical protein